MREISKEGQACWLASNKMESLDIIFRDILLKLNTYSEECTNYRWMDFYKVKTLMQPQSSSKN